MFTWLTDRIYGEAFAAFAREYASRNEAGRRSLETVFEQSLGPSFLVMWRDWQRRHQPQP
jgi:hypothetical protein